MQWTNAHSQLDINYYANECKFQQSNTKLKSQNKIEELNVKKNKLKLLSVYFRRALASFINPIRQEALLWINEWINEFLNLCHDLIH